MAAGFNFEDKESFSLFSLAVNPDTEIDIPDKDSEPDEDEGIRDFVLHVTGGKEDEYSEFSKLDLNCNSKPLVRGKTVDMF